MKITMAEIRKALAAAAGVLAMLVSSGTLTGSALVVVNAILGVLTVAGVYGVKNKPAVPPQG